MDKFLAFSLLIMLLVIFTITREERKNCERLGYKYSYDYGCVKE